MDHCWTPNGHERLDFLKLHFCIWNDCSHMSDHCPLGYLLDLHLYISNDFVSSKIYDKRDDFDFNIVNFPFLEAMFHVEFLMKCVFPDL